MTTVDEKHGIASFVKDKEQAASHSSSTFSPSDNLRWDTFTNPFACFDRKRSAPASFTHCPPGIPNRWQKVVFSALRREEEDHDEERYSNSKKNKIFKELQRHRDEMALRKDLIQSEQLASRQRLGRKVLEASRRYWYKRGETYESLMRVEFDFLKRKYDERRQEDLLRECEETTKKLLSSLIGGSKKLFQSEGSPSETNQEDESCLFPQEEDALSDLLENSLSLLDTHRGKRPLRDYQRSALKWMIHLFDNHLNGILADEMGLGKTVQTIALLAYYAEHKNDWGPHLIVVPSTVVLNWKAEFRSWCPGLKVLTYIGSAKERLKLRSGWTSEDAFHVCITSYNIVVKDHSVFRRRPWGFLVLDEAHQVKNFASKRFQSLFDLNSEHRLLLTGTPLQNSIMELWSLFHFVLPFNSAFRSNEEFREWFSNPMEDMVTGRTSLNQDIVRRLQAMIRPFILRRLKKDVESQLPSKTEKVVLCRLSMRQRFLYDEFMQLADTKQRIKTGGAGGVLKVLLSLRKVCNHPDLFEERPTISPFVIRFEGNISFAVPRLILMRDNCTFFSGFPSDPQSKWAFRVDDVNADKAERYSSLGANDMFYFKENDSNLRALFIEDWWGDSGSNKSAERFSPKHFPSFSNDYGNDLNVSHLDGDEVNSLNALLAASFAHVLDRISLRREECHSQTVRIQQLRYWQQSRAIYVLPSRLFRFKSNKQCFFERFYTPTHAERLWAILPLIRHIAFFVPPVLCACPPELVCHLPVLHFAPFRHHGRSSFAKLVTYVDQCAAERRGKIKSHKLLNTQNKVFDASHFLSELWPLHIRLCFSFPDRRLLIHDCGKLQFLEESLKKLRSEGHRMLIFTQFLQMLTILERFLAVIGFRYLRLDGSTPTEERQYLVDYFNATPSVTCMVLSTRSGGIGLNLIGADTVIFYDSDWNPTMDLQAQDRCHRIGQTKPVTIYRLISEHTVEEAILQKARERKKLNNVVIRGGQFHAIAGVGDAYDDASTAFNALADSVNLRSFFHDLDEDASLPVTDALKSARSNTLLEEMNMAEDEEDREAQRRVVDEIKRHREEEEAEVFDGDSPTNQKEPDTTDTIMSDYLPAAKSLYPYQYPEAEPNPPFLEEPRVAQCVKAKQQEILQKIKSPLDFLMTLRYGALHEGNAHYRYDKLCDQLEDRIHNDSGTKAKQGEPFFPSFKPVWKIHGP